VVARMRSESAVRRTAGTASTRSSSALTLGGKSQQQISTTFNRLAHSNNEAHHRQRRQPPSSNPKAATRGRPHHQRNLQHDKRLRLLRYRSAGFSGMGKPC
jgi:hypothetical protein